MRRLLTPAWFARHGLAAVLVAAFLGLGWWQIRRAAAGNGLSWAYAVEWPVFAGFVVFLWCREVRRELGTNSGRSTGPPAQRPAGRAAPATGFRAPVITARRTAGSSAAEGLPETDVDLAAYNDYLGWLNANPGARPTDYSGRPPDDRHDASGPPVPVSDNPPR